MSSVVYAKTLEQIEKRAHLSSQDVAEIVGSSARSVYRWASGAAWPRSRARDRLLEVNAVVNELSRALKPEAAYLWLHSPNPFLNYERPIDLLPRGEYRRVLAAIEAVEDGVFV